MECRPSRCDLLWSAALQSGTMERRPSRRDLLWSAALQSGTMERRPSRRDLERVGFTVPLWRAALHRGRGSERGDPSPLSERESDADRNLERSEGCDLRREAPSGPGRGPARLPACLTGAILPNSAPSPARPVCRTGIRRPGVLPPEALPAIIRTHGRQSRPRVQVGRAAGSSPRRLVRRFPRLGGSPRRAAEPGRGPASQPQHLPIPGIGDPPHHRSPLSPRP